MAKERKRRLLGLDKTPVASLGEQIFSVQDMDIINVGHPAGMMSRMMRSWM